MKKNIYLLFVLTLAVLPLWADEPYFYDGRGEKVTFSVRKDKVLLKYDSKSGAETLQEQIAAKEMKLLRQDMAIADIDTAKVQLSAIRKISGVSDAGYMLENKSGMLMSPTGKLFIRCREGLSIDRMLEIAGVSKKVILKELHNENAQIYAITFDEKPEDRLSIAARLYETGLCEFVEPSFLVVNTLEPTIRQNIARSATVLPLDTTDYYPMQWGLKNTAQFPIDGMRAGCDINIEPAWAITKGASTIKIAVVDNGVQLDHPDLAGNLLPGYDAMGNQSGDGSPYDIDTSHGTACAGIIAAVDNGVGVVGVAPNCKIIPVKIYDIFQFFPEDIEAGLRYAWSVANADIISCSWSGDETNTYFSSLIAAQIDNAAVYGRDGKGCVVVCAAGNQGNSQVRFPSSLSSTIAVGAISPCGERKTPSACNNGYGGSGNSNYGTGLDVVAPGVSIYTTDLGGSIDSLFRDTSAACPFVSGIAALVLSVDPLLTSQEVREIICSTASYAELSSYGSLSWNFGNGLVKASGAVSLAQTYCKREYINQTITTNTTVSDNDCTIKVQNVTVTNNAKLTLDARREIEVADSFEVTLGSELELMPE